MNPARVAVVGGGITGLAAALALQDGARRERRPLEVVVLEASPRPGGRIRSERERGLLLEWGPDSLLRRKPWAVDLCRRLGLTDRLAVVSPAARRTYVAVAGRLLPLPGEGAGPGFPLNPRALLRSPVLSWPGRLRLAAEPWIPPRRDTSEESLASFARRRLGTEAARRILEPFLKAPYAGDPRQLSLQATFPQLRELELKYGSLWRALQRSGEAAKVVDGTAGRGDDEPIGSPFITLSTGLETLVTTAASRLGTALRTGVSVRQVQPLAGGAWRVETTDGNRETFEGLILTTPAFASARLLEDHLPQAAEPLAAIPYRDVGVAFLAWPRPSVGHPLTGSGFLVPEDETLTVRGCSWVSSKWPHAAPGDVALLRCFFDPEARDFDSDGPAGAGAGREGTGPDSSILDRMREDLSRLLDIRGEPVLSRLCRLRRALPQYTLGHLDRVATIRDALSGHPRLRLAGAAFTGVGVPDCVRQGEEAARELLEALD